MLEIAALVEIEGQLLVDLDRREMGMRALVFEKIRAKNRADATLSWAGTMV